MSCPGWPRGADESASGLDHAVVAPFRDRRTTGRRAAAAAGLRGTARARGATAGRGAAGAHPVADRAGARGVPALRPRRVLRPRGPAPVLRGGGDYERVTLSALDAEGRDEGVDSLALDQALTQLEALDARKARVVELRYFAGLEMAEIAEMLDISRATAQRDWEVARTLLYRALA
ncbi:MAG: hypothetical protein KAX77_01160 [Xanthomonadales bacterium]|nr:hypothetical protein [Xanthomonadales bacterium]